MNEEEFEQAKKEFIKESEFIAKNKAEKELFLCVCSHWQKEILKAKDLKELCTKAEMPIRYCCAKNLYILHAGRCERLVEKVRHKAVELQLKETKQTPQVPESNDVIAMASWIDNTKKAIKVKRNQKDKFSAESKLLAVFLAHQDWTKARIAEEAGLSRQSAYNSPLFTSTYDKMKQEKKDDWDKRHQKNQV